MSLEVDGPDHPFRDPLPNQLVGEWKITGRTAGEQIQHYGMVDWVLNHQFLRIYFLDVGSNKNRGKKKKKPAYEAMVFVGYDNMSERYVVHWLDIFGGRFSEVLGFGQGWARTRSGSSSMVQPGRSTTP